MFMKVLFRLGGKGDSVQELIDKKSRGHANKGRLIFRNKPEFIFMQLTARLDADAAGSRQIFEKISLDYSVYFNAERYDWVGITVHHGVTVGGGHYTSVLKDGKEWWRFNDSASPIVRHLDRA